MQRIQDFRRENEDRFCTMYIRLARFSKESRGVFVKSQLVKVLLSKIDKHLIVLTLPKIIVNYGGRATFAEDFSIVEQCDRALCKHDATDLVSLLVNSSKSLKILVAATRLAEAEMDKTLYCWSCGQADHAKKDCFLKQR